MAFTKKNSKQNKRALILTTLVVFMIYFTHVVYQSFAGALDFIVMACMCIGFFLLTYKWSARFTLRAANGSFGQALLYHIPVYVGAMGFLMVLSVLSGALTWDPDDDWEIENFAAVLFPLLLASYAGLGLYLWEQAAAVKADHEELCRQYQQRESEYIQLHDQALRQYSWPHFLNNTLGAIRVLTRTDPQKAIEAINLTIEIMHFYIDNKDRILIPLQTEIDQVRHLLKVYEIRYEKRLYLDIDTGSKPAEKLILAMILICLVENACIHGDLTNAARSAKLNIYVDLQGTINIHLVNAIGPEALEGVDSMGKGLAIIEERLATQFPNHHFLRKNVSKDSLFEIHIGYFPKSTTEK